MQEHAINSVVSTNLDSAEQYSEYSEEHLIQTEAFCSKTTIATVLLLDGSENEKSISFTSSFFF